MTLAMYARKTLYEIKFNNIANCNKSYCKNTCNMIMQQWNSAENMFLDFKTDVLGKCDICFRAGFCQIEECDKDRSDLIVLVNGYVENGNFRKRIEKSREIEYTNANKIAKLLTKNSLKRVENSLNKMLRSSLKYKDPEIFEDEVKMINDNYIYHTKEKLKDFDYNNFLVGCHMIIDATAREVNGLIKLNEEYQNLCNMKTISPVDLKKKREQEKTRLKEEISNYLNRVKSSIDENMKTLSNLCISSKRSIDRAKNMIDSLHLKRILNKQEKIHLNNLVKEVNDLTHYTSKFKEIIKDLENELGKLNNISLKINE